ncbi:unnamed protein product [Bursaphelenchus xylophilus]|uniref:(pine wood nematode) hypothetical protein n=1 Tax=Bursaphelenchus xylophilus TaxID=6326 RepID=A0A1I7RJK9_BURXY|nr:unnamed protein product [Bursaphelenchus xylophilus]CAG9128935.1 unnamed protein product [Bursaphelenchus xylophilus]
MDIQQEPMNGFSDNGQILMLFKDWVDHFVAVSPYIELLICIPSIVINIYSAIRFANLNSYSNNFRIVMISTNFIVAGASLFHPITSMTPMEYISFADGHYIAGILFYMIAFTHHGCVFIFDIKFFILGFERWVAFRSRATYEYSQDNSTIKVFISIIILACFMLIVKLFCYIHFNHTDSYDVILSRALVLEFDLPTLISTHFFASISWLYAGVVFARLLRTANEHRFLGQTLSESYQIKETISILSVIGPIIRAYLGVVIFCSICVSLNMYGILYGRWQERSSYYQGLTNLEYICINIYNFYASSYAIWHLRPLRKVFLMDIRSLFRTSIDIENQVNPGLEKHADEAKVYFDQLQNQWS